MYHSAPAPCSETDGEWLDDRRGSRIASSRDDPADAAPRERDPKKAGQQQSREAPRRLTRFSFADPCAQTRRRLRQLALAAVHRDHLSRLVPLTGILKRAGEAAMPRPILPGSDTIALPEATVKVAAVCEPCRRRHGGD